MSGKQHDSLSEALEQFGSMLIRYSSVFQGVVEAVDEVAFTADIKALESVFYAVPLRVLKSAQASVIEIPKLQTPCLLCFRNNNLQLPQLLMVHEADKLLINTPKTIFNGGELGGMVKAKELKTQSEKDKAVLDALLSIINGAPINEPGNGAPSALQIALKSALTGKTPGTWNQLENDKILQ